MVSAILSRLVILVFGTLYPAYASYKAVKTKNVKEYVKWMMYWIVFALFCCLETFSDVFLSWVPFYYEVKIVFVFWLLSPVTKGSSFLYKKFVHPQLNKREKEIDEAILQARTKGYSTMMTLGHRGLTYATNVVVKTAIKGQSTLVDHIRKSYSTNDLRVRNTDQVDHGINDSDEEFGLVKADTDKNGKNKIGIIKKKSSLENRLMEDNRELQHKASRSVHGKSPLSRSQSDASDKRRHTAKSLQGLSRLEEVEHEASIIQEQITNEDGDEEITTVTEEIVYYPKRTYTNKEDNKMTEPTFSKTNARIKSDPYATLPRTRSRQRPRLNQL